MEQPVAFIAGWGRPSVQSEQLDTRGLPFQPDLFTAGVPALVTEAIAAELPASPVPLDRVSSLHGRSFEIGDASKVTALWSDAYGNLYTSLSLKGNRFDEPGITTSATAPSGYIPNGLQEDDAMLRIARSSKLLRENGIPTEWLVRIVEPATIPFNGDNVSQAVYRKRLLGSVIGSVPLEKAGEVALAVENMTFYATARCMEINDRPFDFLGDSTPEAMSARLQKIFTVYNLTHAADEGFRELSAASSADRTSYFTEVLPRLLGRNMAKLHDAGLVHRFPVAGNVTALGGIVDLDSVYGEPLGIGDAPITLRDKMNDFMKAFELGNRSYAAIMQHVMETTGWFDSDETAADEFMVVGTMQQAFLESYYEHSTLSFDGRERALLFLALHGEERSISLFHETYGQLRELLAGFEPLTSAINVEFDRLLDRDRSRTAEHLTAYATMAIDEHSERHGTPKDLPELCEALVPMTTDVIGNIEARSVHGLAVRLSEGNESAAFDELVRQLDLEREDDKPLRDLLARVFISPFTYFEQTDREEFTEPLLRLRKQSTEAIVDILSSERQQFRMLALRVPHVASAADETDPPRYRFNAIEYEVLPRVDRNVLDRAIAEYAGDGIVVVHDDPGGLQESLHALHALPISQVISDAERIVPQKVVTDEGAYMQRFSGSRGLTYIAVVTAADTEGKVHIMIRPFANS